jgi:hypothetical protein
MTFQNILLITLIFLCTIFVIGLVSSLISKTIIKLFNPNQKEDVYEGSDGSEEF